MSTRYTYNRYMLVYIYILNTYYIWLQVLIDTFYFDTVLMTSPSMGGTKTSSHTVGWYGHGRCHPYI